MIDEIKSAFNSVIKDRIKDIELMYSNQNHVYKVNTENKKYIIKRYEIMDGEKDLKIRREQLRISKIWNENGINTILPITDIFKYLDYYYIVFPYVDGNVYKEGELDIEKIKVLARLLAKMHKLNIETFLMSHTKMIDEEIIDNDVVRFFIEENNKSSIIGNSNLCVCHNDYKHLNIVWDKQTPYLIDFDAVEKNNRTYSLLEAAYTFAYDGHKLNLDIYETFINEYKLEYKEDIKDLKEAIYGCWSGKIQWLIYLKKNRYNDEDIDLLINKMVEYKKYEKKIKEILFENIKG